MDNEEEDRKAWNLLELLDSQECTDKICRALGGLPLGQGIRIVILTVSGQLLEGLSREEIIGLDKEQDSPEGSRESDRLYRIFMDRIEVVGVKRMILDVLGALLSCIPRKLVVKSWDSAQGKL